MELTDQQRAVLRYVERYRAEYGFSPTVREIAIGLGMGRSTVQYHLQRMADEGVVRRAAGSPARTLTIPEKGMKALEIVTMEEQ